MPGVTLIVLVAGAGALRVDYQTQTLSAGGVTMPAWGWLMMGLGIFFTVVVGCGLMILMFYKSRRQKD